MMVITENSEPSFLKDATFVACAISHMTKTAPVQEVRVMVDELLSNMKPLDIEQRIQFRRRLPKASCHFLSGKKSDFIENVLRTYLKPALCLKRI